MPIYLLSNLKIRGRKSVSIWKELLKVGAVVAKESINVDQVQKNDEFQRKKADELERLEKCDDVFILNSFHSRYASFCGNGFVLHSFSANTKHLQDPVFCAFQEIFQKRGFRRATAECSFCGNSLGFRWHVRMNITDKPLSRLGHDVGGRYSNTNRECSCGKYGRWELVQEENGYVNLQLLT